MTKWEGLPEVWRETVRSEWCDYNDHLNMSYYVLIFFAMFPLVHFS